MTADQAKQLLTDPKFLAFAAGKKMEWNYGGTDTNQDWQAIGVLYDSNFRESYNRIRIAPEPARVPLEAKDWDGPTWWVRNSLANGAASLVTDYSSDISRLRVCGEWATFEQIMTNGWERSRDRVTWAPCWKLEDKP